MLLQSSATVLYTEFQTAPDETMPFRMADYYLRLRWKFPQQEIQQVVIYLKRTTSPLVRQTSYQTPVMTHQFRVIRLWEQPVEVFLSTPGLLPYAVLSQAADKQQVLARVVQQLEQITDPREQNNLTAATSILAGLELEAQTIRQLMRIPAMRECPMYQYILREGEVIGERQLVLKLLNRKLGSLSADVTAKISLLSHERLEALGEPLLDFNSGEDLEYWLERSSDN